MITGFVNDRLEAVIPIWLPDISTRGLHRFSATIDTGFDHYLMLPREFVELLGLSVVDTLDLVLGNEQSHQFELCFAVILWDNEPMPIPVLVSEGECLVGVRLLAGCHLTATMVPGGPVTVGDVSDLQ